MPGKTGLHLRCTCTTETLETAYPIPVRRWSRFRRFTQSRRVRLPPVVGTTCPADKAMAARAPGGPALTAGDLALSVVEMPPGACALTRSVEDVPCSVPAHFAIFRFQLSGYVPVFFRNALAQDLHARKRRSLLLPAVTLDPMGCFAREGRQMCSLIRGSLHQATEQATPQCRARRERMARHRPLPRGRLICNRRRRCFDPVPVTGAVHLGASSCQQPGSPRSGRRQNSRSGLSEAYGTVAAAEWGDPGCVADTGFSRYLAGEGRMVLRLTVINVAQGREAGA